MDLDDCPQSRSQPLAGKEPAAPADSDREVEMPSEDPEFVDLDAWHARFQGLPPRTRKAVVLRHVVGLGYEEIAIATGQAVGTVKSDIHRGLGKIT